MRHSPAKTPSEMTVRIGRDGLLWAIWAVIDGEEMWMAGLLTEEARREYLGWHPEWKVEERTT